MNRLILFVCLIAFNSNAHSGITGWLFGYKNRWECILDRMPGTESDIEAEQIYRQCVREAPESYVEQKTTGSLFGAGNAGECVKENVEQDSSRKGAMYISAACTRLYRRGAIQKYDFDG